MFAIHIRIIYALVNLQRNIYIFKLHWALKFFKQPLKLAATDAGDGDGDGDLLLLLNVSMAIPAESPVSAHTKWPNTEIAFRWWCRPGIAQTKYYFHPRTVQLFNELLRVRGFEYPRKWVYMFISLIYSWKWFFIHQRLHGCTCTTVWAGWSWRGGVGIDSLKSVCLQIKCAGSRICHHRAMVCDCWRCALMKSGWDHPKLYILVSFHQLRIARRCFICCSFIFCSGRICVFVACTAHCILLVRSIPLLGRIRISPIPMSNVVDINGNSTLPSIVNLFIVHL